MKTSGNSIFISGGSAGIGFEIAKLFSEKGNKVIINGRNKDRLDKALLQLRNSVGIQGDLSIESERLRIAGILRSEHPDLNMIINNAGEAYAYSLAEAKGAYQNAQKEINTNYITIIHFTELLLPFLIEKIDAAIVNVSSVVALIPGTGAPTYSASKAALHFYTQSLRKSLTSVSSLKVFELMPPLVNTEFSAGIGGANGLPPREVAEELLLGIGKDQLDVPIGRTKVVYGAITEAMAKLELRQV